MNYDYIKNIKYAKLFFIIITFIVFFITLVLLSFVKCYDTYEMYANYDGVNLNVSVLIENSDIIKRAQFFKYNSKIMKYSIIQVSELLEKENNNYQIYSLKIKGNPFIKNEIVKVVFYYNRERIIKKIIRIIF